MLLPSSIIKIFTSKKTTKETYTPFAQLPSDIFFFVLEFCDSNFVLETEIGIKEITDDKFINWKSFLKVWYGKFRSDGKITFLFKNGTIKDCKKNANLAQVKFLLRQMKNVNSSNIRYWETQIVNQITKVSDKKMVPQLKYDLNKFAYKSQITNEKKIEKMYLEPFCIKLENLTKKSKDNMIVFNSIKYVDLKEVPKNLELVKPLLNLFPNMEHLKLMNIFSFSLEKGIFTSPFEKCTKLEINISYLDTFTRTISFRNINYFPNLEHLTFNGNFTVENIKNFQQLKNLTTLKSTCDELDLDNETEHFYTLLSKLPKLETLHLDSTAWSLPNIVELSNSLTLRSLKLASRFIYDPNIKPIEGFPSLTSLCLDDDISFMCLSTIGLKYLKIKIAERLDTWHGLGLLSELTSLTLVLKPRVHINSVCNDLNFRENLVCLKKLNLLAFEFQKGLEINNETLLNFIKWINRNLENCVKVKLTTCYYDERIEEILLNPRDQIEEIVQNDSQTLPIEN